MASWESSAAVGLGLHAAVWMPRISARAAHDDVTDADGYAAEQKTRTTTGTFANGEQFTITDDWRDQGISHRILEQPWTGSTTFLQGGA